MKSGGTVRMVATLHRFLLDNDLTEDEKTRYERTLRFLTSKASMVEHSATKEDTDNPFA
jgi:hypothetical protein